MSKSVTIYDLAVLHEYFSKKTEPTEQDKQRIKKLDESLCSIVDGLVNKTMPLEDILKEILEVMPPKNQP